MNEKIVIRGTKTLEIEINDTANPETSFVKVEMESQELWVSGSITRSGLGVYYAPTTTR